MRLLIMLNGYPGVGKLSIGRELAALVGGRLLDNHSVYNVAFALTAFKSPAFYDTVRKVQAIADALMADLPAGTPVILTEVLTAGSDWADECWARVLRLGEMRGGLFVVHLICDLDENKRRIASAERASKRKPLDPDLAQRNHDAGRPLMGGDSEHCMRLDVTGLTARQAAEAILAWLTARAAAPPR